MKIQGFGAAMVGYAQISRGAVSREEATARLVAGLPEGFKDGGYYVVTFEEAAVVLVNDLQDDLDGGSTGADIADLLDRIHCIMNGNYMCNIEVDFVEVTDDEAAAE